MPAYYWIQLYKAPIELAVEIIVRRTVDGLISAGCNYQFSSITKIEDDSLPQEKQRIITNDNLEINVDEAISYATKDIEDWRTTKKAKKWLPGITIIFEFAFEFDKELTEKFKDETAKKVKQVKLDFWVTDDKFFEEKIVINLDTWEEYVLMYGQEETHKQNKKKILKIIESICNQITPHYGWLDSESNSHDTSYELIDTNNWSVGNEFIVIGPQLINRIPKYQLKEKVNLVNTLENGCLILS